MAFYGWPIAQCQSIDTPLSVQLESGIRVLDIRLALVKDRLIAYHGITPQRTPFHDILTTMHAFLTAPASSRETLVVSIKQEDFATTPAPKFSAAVHTEMFSGPGGKEMWYLENRIPRLGEVRGKAVLFSRFGGNCDGWDGGGLGSIPRHGRTARRIPSCARMTGIPSRPSCPSPRISVSARGEARGGARRAGGRAH